jgi:hypothetical protein
MKMDIKFTVLYFPGSIQSIFSLSPELPQQPAGHVTSHIDHLQSLHHRSVWSELSCSAVLFMQQHGPSQWNWTVLWFPSSSLPCWTRCVFLRLEYKGSLSISATYSLTAPSGCSPSKPVHAISILTKHSKLGHNMLFHISVPWVWSLPLTPLMNSNWFSNFNFYKYLPSIRFSSICAKPRVPDSLTPFILLRHSHFWLLVPVLWVFSSTFLNKMFEFLLLGFYVLGTDFLSPLWKGEVALSPLAPSSWR